MNGKNTMRLVHFICVGFFCVSFLFPALNWAGNKEHVENRVEELDDMNKEIVGGFSDIPQNGTINYKAIVKENNSGPQVKIIEKNIEMVPSSASTIRKTQTANKNTNLIKTQTQKTEME